jgi:biopolymer transport protein ExbD
VSERSIHEKLFGQLPQFGLLAGGTVFCALVGLWVLIAIEGPDSKGIFVHALPAAAYKSAFDPWTQPLVIRVDAEHRYYLNSILVKIEDLPVALTQLFSTRANRTVYVDGDPNATYDDIIQAADAVRTARGRVVLSTATSSRTR